MPATPEMFDTALRYVHTFRDHGATGIDLLHLAAAEGLQRRFPHAAVRFICSDGPLSNVAAARGVRVFDPEREDVSRLT
jgi:hypothetical protein